jgi:hypothetical protein
MFCREEMTISLLKTKLSIPWLGLIAALSLVEKVLRA